MKKKGIIGIIIAAVAVAAIVTVILIDNAEPKEYVKTSYAMGTEVIQKLTGKGAEQVAEEIQKSMVFCENREISRRVATSDISRLNESKSAEVGENTAGYIQRMADFAKDCEGAVDITAGELINLWNIGEGNFKVPTQKELKTALKTVDYKKIKVENDKITIGRDQSIDLGCSGKGIACDEAEKVLEKYSLGRAVISVGGSVLLWSKDTSEMFTVGIRDPKGDESAHAMTVKLPCGIVSTSGAYERFSKDENGKIYHHILSTENGYPVENGVASATVFCDNGEMSDALSTACFILGPEKSEKLLEKYNAKAVFIKNNGDVVTSDNFDFELKITSSYYKLKK